MRSAARLGGTNLQPGKVSRCRRARTTSCYETTPGEPGHTRVGGGLAPLTGRCLRSPDDLSPGGRTSPGCIVKARTTINGSCYETAPGEPG